MTSHPERAVLALIGLRASGKSSVGAELARLAGVRCVELDDELARAPGLAPALREGGAGAVLRELGEPAFRELESAALQRALASRQPIVLATGGGVVEREANRALLREHAVCVWLRAEVAVLARRMRADTTPRPALLGGGDPVGEIAALAARREAWYAELAALTLDATAFAPRTLAQSILDAHPAWSGMPGRA